MKQTYLETTKQTKCAQYFFCENIDTLGDNIGSTPCTYLKNVFVIVYCIDSLV